jgi:hypothetical protein
VNSKSVSHKYPRVEVKNKFVSHHKPSSAILPHQRKPA